MSALKPPEKRKLLWVDWVDASTCSQAWNFPEDMPGIPESIQSVGWVVRENDDAITIAAHWGNDSVSGDMTIPKIAIVQIWEIDLWT